MALAPRHRVGGAERLLRTRTILPMTMMKKATILHRTTRIRIMGMGCRI